MDRQLAGGSRDGPSEGTFDKINNRADVSGAWREWRSRGTAARTATEKAALPPYWPRNGKEPIGSSGGGAAFSLCFGCDSVEETSR